MSDYEECGCCGECFEPVNVCGDCYQKDLRAKLQAAEMQNGELVTRLFNATTRAEAAEAGLPLLSQIDEYLDKHPYPALDADIHWGAFHHRVKNVLAAPLETAPSDGTVGEGK